MSVCLSVLHLCHPYFLLITVTFIDFTRVSPPEGCHPAPFYLSDLVCPLFFVKSPTNFFPSVSLPGGCHPGPSAPPLVTPLEHCGSFWYQFDVTQDIRGCRPLDRFIVGYFYVLVHHPLFTSYISI